MVNIIDTTVNWMVKNYGYTPYQIFRTLEIMKEGQKQYFKLTKKQKEIWKKFLYLVGEE